MAKRPPLNGCSYPLSCLTLEDRPQMAALFDHHIVDNTSTKAKPRISLKLSQPNSHPKSKKLRQVSQSTKLLTSLFAEISDAGHNTRLSKSEEHDLQFQRPMYSLRIHYIDLVHLVDLDPHSKIC